MAVQRIFYMTPSGMTVFYCHKGCIELLARFEMGEVEEFCDYVAQQPDVTSAMVVDVVEEEFRTDHIPHVTGADRRRLLSRKKAAMFRHTRLCSTQIIKREDGKRKYDLVLFAGLTRPETLEPWIEQLHLNKVPLVGIYSMSNLAQLLMKKMGLDHPNAELLSIQQGSLLRQSFFNNSELKSSRLTNVDSGDEEACLNGILSEVERNQQYLGRMQLLRIGEPVFIYILSAGRQIEHLRSGCVGSDQLDYHLIDLNDVARKVGLEQPLKSDQAEYCLCYMLSRWLPHGNYATQMERGYYRQYRLRNQLKVASVLLVLACSSWSAGHVLDSFQLSQESTDLVKFAQLQAHEYKRQVDRLPDLNYSPKVMRSAVEHDHKLKEHKPGSLKALVIIGSVLLEHSNVIVDELSWGVEVWVDDYGVEKRMEVAKIKAHLDRFPKDYQRAFEQVDALARDLSRDPRVYGVDALSLPLNTDPGSSLEGESQRLGGSPVAKFELKIRLVSQSESDNGDEINNG